MGDTIFQWSLIGLTLLVIGWIAGGILAGIGVALPVISGIVVEIGGGIILLHYWGKGYMSRW